jgi:hypothetical protein
MVTYEQLREYLSRRPFQPFRLLLTSGASFDVTEMNQVVAMKRRVYMGDTHDAPMWVWLKQIDRVEHIEAQPA